MSVFLALVLIPFGSGCALWNRVFPEGEKSPAELIEDGRRELERGYYKAATETFEKIRDRYPYSKYAVEAELKLADSLYKRKLYDEAFDAYDEFEKLHPKNTDIPYVVYQKGMCHFSQVRSVDRDQSHTLKARDEFERLVKRFPKSKYANCERMALHQRG